MGDTFGEQPVVSGEKPNDSRRELSELQKAIENQPPETKLLIECMNQEEPLTVAKATELTERVCKFHLEKARDILDQKVKDKDIPTAYAKEILNELRSLWEHIAKLLIYTLYGGTMALDKKAEDYDMRKYHYQIFVRKFITELAPESERIVSEYEADDDSGRSISFFTLTGKAYSLEVKTTEIIEENFKKIKNPAIQKAIIDNIYALNGNLIHEPYIYDRYRDESERELQITIIRLQERLADAYFTNLVASDPKQAQEFLFTLKDRIVAQWFDVRDYLNRLPGKEDYNTKAEKLLRSLPLPDNPEKLKQWIVFCRELSGNPFMLVPKLLERNKGSAPVVQLDVDRFNPKDTEVINTVLLTHRQLADALFDKTDKDKRHDFYHGNFYHHDSGGYLDHLPQEYKRSVDFLKTAPDDVRQMFQDELDENEQTKKWLAGLQKEAKSFFRSIASSSNEFTNPQAVAIRENPAFYEQNASLFITEYLIDIYERYMRSKRQFPEIGYASDYFSQCCGEARILYPTLSLFLRANPRNSFAIMEEEFSCFGSDAERKHQQSNPQKELKTYQDKKDKTLDRAKTELRQAQIHYDAQRKGLAYEERENLDYIDRFVKNGDLDFLLNELPFAFDLSKDNVRRVSSRLVQQKFPRVDVALTIPENFAGIANPRTNQYEVLESRQNYENFLHVNTHEYLHLTVQDLNSYNLLSEGITEYLTKRILGRRKTKENAYLSYPEAVTFVKRLERNLGNDILCTFYTAVEVPAVNFQDLPKINIDGQRKTFIDGVDLRNAQDRYLCRKILDQIDINRITNDTYANQYEACQYINTFLKLLFQTTHRAKYDRTAIANFKKLATDFDNLLITYG